MLSRSIYAHSVPGSPTELWEPLSEHLVAVGEEAAGFADRFGWAEAGRTAGLLHDIGKCSAEFQAYIRRSTAGEPGLRGPDHSTAGAREAVTSYGARLGRMLAYVIAGHHAGLPDATDLDRRLGGDIPPYPGWSAESGLPPPPASLRNTHVFKPSDHKGFQSVFLIRMLPVSALPPEQRGRDLGWMLHDIDFANDRTSRFFRARLSEGVLDVQGCLKEGVAA